MEKYPNRVIVRLTSQQSRQLQQLALDEGVTISQTLRKLIEDKWDKNMRKAKR